MSRHRDIRNLDYDEEYDQAYDDAVYGHSVDDYDYGVSPGMEEYLYSRSRDNSNKFAAYFHTDEDIEEVEEANEDEKGELERARHDSSSFERPKLSDGDEKKLSSALDEIRSIVGDQFTETEMVRMVLRYNYDINAAVNGLLGASCPPSASTALPQRERRQRNKDSCILQLNSDYAVLPYHEFSPVLSFLGTKCVKTNVQKMVKDWTLELERKRKKEKTSEERKRVKDDSICSSESMSTDTNEESESTLDKEVDYLSKENEQEMELEISCPVDEVDFHVMAVGERDRSEKRIDLASKRDWFDTTSFGDTSGIMEVDNSHLHSKYSRMSSNDSNKPLGCSRPLTSVPPPPGFADLRNSDVRPELKFNLPGSSLSALASSSLGTCKTKGFDGSALPASQPERSHGSSACSDLGTLKLEGSGLCTLYSSNVEPSKFGGIPTARVCSQIEASIPKDSTLSAISSSYLQPFHLEGNDFTLLACSPKVLSESGSSKLSDLASSHLRASTSWGSSSSTTSSSNLGIPKLGGSSSLSSLASSNLESSKPGGISLSSLASSHLGTSKSGNTTLSSLASSHLGSPKPGNATLSSLASSHLGSIKPGSTTLSSLASSHVGSTKPGNTTLSSLASSHLGSPKPGSTTLSSLASSDLGSPKPGSTTLFSLASSDLGSPKPGSTTLSSLASSHLGSPKPGSTTLSSLASSDLGSLKPGSTTLFSLASSTLGSPKPGSTTLSSLASSDLGSPKVGGTSLSSLAVSHLGVTKLDGENFKTSNVKGDQLSGNDDISSSSLVSSTSSYIIPALTTNSQFSGSKPGLECRGLDSRLGSFGSKNKFLSLYSDIAPENSGDRCDGAGFESNTGDGRGEIGASSLESLAQLHLSKIQEPKFGGYRKDSKGHMGSLVSSGKVEPSPVDFMFFSSPFGAFTEDTEKDYEMDDIDLSIAFTKQQEYEKIKQDTEIEVDLDFDLDIEECPFIYDEQLRHRGPISDLGHLLIKSEFTCKVNEFRFSTIEVDLPVFDFNTPSPDDIVRESINKKNKT